MNQEIKGNLARLLATENLIVEHRKVSTASFDVDRRILTLPNWDRASSIVYDMLVGHEVGHALFTPNEDWKNMFDCPKDFVNVIEDARIEKLMKRKYPGLRKSFVGGYKELNDEDFFGIADQELSNLSLIDRINLHFKIGSNAMIPFSVEEQLFVARTDIAETFKEVCQIAVDVYEFSKQENFVEQSLQVEPQESADSEESENENTDTEQQEQQNPMAGINNADPVEEDEEDEEDVGSSNEGGESSQTQRSFNECAEDLTDRYSSNNLHYVEIPDTVNTSDYIVDWKEVHDWIDEFSQRLNIDDVYDNVDKSYMKFRKESQKEVNYLVKEFECHKSADAYARAGQSKTGVLDTTKLHTYKYNEDLFKKVTVLPDGKNHGMIFILDWSGSMSNELFATVKQLLNLTSFCKKVRIPFEVYAFTNEWGIVERIHNTHIRYDGFDEEISECREGKVFLNRSRFHLINFVSSRSNSKNYERMCRNLYREAYAYTYCVKYQTTPGISLSGTPLNEAIVMLNYIIPEFKQQNDLQKVNVCIMTDGESCQATYGRKFYNDHRDEYYIRPRRIDSNTVLRDRKTGRTYASCGGWTEMTNNFINQVRDRNPSVNIIGFRIMSGNGLSTFISQYAEFYQYDKVQRQWKKERSAIIPMPKSYSALYVINNNSLNQDAEFEVETGASKGEITKAFKKMLSRKSTNKKLLSSFIEHVA